MTTGNNGLPPQAYTKETLANAYEWVKTQPQDVRRSATNSDSLVGLYLSSLRRQQDGFDSFYEREDRPQRPQASHPVSGEQFKKELKTLAVGLDEFAEPASPSHGSQPNTAPTTSKPPTHPEATAPTPRSRGAATGGEDLLKQLDSLSLQRVQSLRMGLNLSSDTEALRMLISVGFERAKELLPKP